MKKYKTTIGLFIFLFLLLPTTVHAGAGSISLTGNGKMNTGATGTVDVYANVTNGLMNTTGGAISSSDPSCVSIVSASGLGGEGTYENGMLMFYTMSGTSSKSVIRINLKAGNSECTATLSLTGITMAFTDDTVLDLPATSKTITVSKPAENNNNNNTGGNNNNTGGNNTGGNSNTGGNNNTNTGGNNTGGNTNSGGSSNNGGSTNNEDKRSKDANLKSLTVSNGTLSPGFSAGTTSYTMQVGLDVTKLDISAEPSDDKAKVSINNPELAENARTTVTIKVTAENGSTKTYTINVVRGELPEDPLKDDNKLASLVPSVGILSPKFDPDKLKYYVYLPYEIDTIDFEYTLSDSNSAQADFEGDKELKANAKNVFKIIVKAEDGSEKVYTITVYRAVNPEFIDNDSVKIKSLKIGSANLIGEFDSDKAHYYYTGELDLSDIVPEDSNATYEIIDEGDVTYIVVEAPNGDVGIYCFHKEEEEETNSRKKRNIAIIVLSVTTGLGTAGTGCLLFDKYYLARKRKLKIKQLKG